MDRFHRHEKEAMFTANAKATSLMFIVAIIALLAAQTTETPGEGTTMASVREPTREVPVVAVDVPDGYKLPGQQPAETATSAAR